MPRSKTPGQADLPYSGALPANHPDHRVLKDIADALYVAAGGSAELEVVMATIVRNNIDRVIQTPKTGRRFYTDLQNSEKTYIGTAVEIDLRSALGLERGVLMDLAVAGHDVDVKFSNRDGGWMIPPEAVGKVCILLSANDTTGVFSFGLVVARREYLTERGNRDQKLTISKTGRENVWWLIRKAEYPGNFWLSISPEIVHKISEGRSGNQRMMTLFREVQDRAISRKVVEDVASQLDPTRRVRADKSRGTRNVLERDKIFLLSGANRLHRELLEELNLPRLRRTEYLAHRFTDEELEKATAKGIKF